MALEGASEDEAVGGDDELGVAQAPPLPAAKARSGGMSEARRHGATLELNPLNSKPFSANFWKLREERLALPGKCPGDAIFDQAAKPFYVPRADFIHHMPLAGSSFPTPHLSRFPRSC